MNKLKQYQLTLAGAVVLAVVVTVFAVTRKSSILMLLPFIALGLLGSILTGQYKMETYRIIGEVSPGSYERLLREGEVIQKDGVPYPKEVEALVKGYERFRKLATWLPMETLVVGLIADMILRNV